MAQEQKQDKGNKDDDASYTVDVVKLWGNKGPCRDNYAYFIIDKESSECMVVDPAVCEPTIMKRYKELKEQNKELQLVGVLTTHKHHDHSAGNGDLKKKFKDIKVYGGKVDNVHLGKNSFTDEVVEGDIIKLGKHTKISVYDVPCHTQGHVLYYITDNNDKYPSLVTGDTLFVGGVGHFFEGSAAEMLKNFKKISAFPKDTKIWVGHEYAFSNYQFCAFIEPDNEAIKPRLEWARKQKEIGGICVPSTVQIEMDTNVFMRTGVKAVQDNLKEQWKNAGKARLGKVPARFSVQVDSAKWCEADVMGGLRHLKTSGVHNDVCTSSKY